MNLIIQFAIDKIAKNSVKFAGGTADVSLQISKEVVHRTLIASGELLKLLSKIGFLPREWREGLLLGFDNLGKSAEITAENLEASIHATRHAFEIALESMDRFKDHSIDLIYDNRYVSSVIGSAHNSKIILSDIKMSFRKDGKDVSTDEILEDFFQSGKKKILLYVPGLFTDESLWKDNKIEIDGRTVVSRGIDDHCIPDDMHSVFIRFNHGKHISENGKDLLATIEYFLQKAPGTEIHIISYSLGCLVVRSLLYYAREKTSPIINENIKKVIFIASPDGGSYLEKAGFWLGFLLEKTPYLALQILGTIGNLRSDAIKDLSHGIIREEDWNRFNPISRYWQDKYFGELDNIDCYQFYSSFGEEGSPLQSWMGDGIVEQPSLTFLKDIFLKKSNPEIRSVDISGTNHFTILQSQILMSTVKEIMHSHSGT